MRSQVIGNASMFAYLGWIVNTPNEGYLIYSVPGRSIVGEAYSYGDKATPATFRSEIDEGLIPRNWMASPHVPANPPAEYTGTDCSGFVSRCLAFPEAYVNSTGSNDFYIYARLVDSPKMGDIGWVTNHVFLEAGDGMMYEANPRGTPAGGNRVQFLRRSDFETLSIFPTFEEPFPAENDIIEETEAVNLSITVRATGILYNDAVALFVNGQMIGDFVVYEQGADEWEVRKENYDVSGGGKFNVRVIAGNEIVSNNRYFDEYTWSFTVNGPPIVKQKCVEKGGGTLQNLVLSNSDNLSALMEGSACFFNNYAEDVPIDVSKISFTFSKPMDQSVTYAAISVDPSFLYTVSWEDEKTINLEVSQLLDYCKEYTIKLSDKFVDTSGVKLDGNEDGEPGGGPYEFKITTETPELRLTMNPRTHLFELKNPGDCKSRTGVIRIDGSKVLRDITFALRKRVSGSEPSFSGGEGVFSIPAESSHNVNFTVEACDEGGISVDLEAIYKGNVCGTTAGGYSASLRKKKDHPDENQSPGLSNYPTSLVLVDDTLSNPDEVGIFIYGWTIGYAHLLGKYKMPVVPIFSDFTYWKNPGTLLSDELPLIVVGSGALSGFNSSEFKQKLEDYVVNGGNLIVLTQKFGSDLSILPGEINGYGWNEDQSCFKSAAYLSQWHPVFSAQTKKVMNCNVDGYISGYPSNTEVLLGRTKNAMPALLYYNYGAGTVIVSSLYTDWGYGHNQSSALEVRLIRDLTTWAQNPDMEILEFYPDSSVSVPVSIKYTANDTILAANAIIKVYTPDRELYDSTSIPVSLDSGEESEWIWDKSSISYNLGLWVINYALMDGDENWIQGYNRGAIFAQKVDVPTGDYNVGDFNLWVNSDKEEIIKGDTVNFEIFIKNNTDTLFTGKLMIGHHGAEIDSFTNLTLPPDTIVNINYKREMWRSRTLCFGLYESEQYDYGDWFNKALVSSRKGIWTISNPFPISISLNKSYVLGIDTLYHKVTIENSLSASCSPFFNIYTLLDSVRYDLWSDTVVLAAKDKKEIEGKFFPMDFDTTVGKEKLCCEMFYRDGLWYSTDVDFELTHPNVQFLFAFPDSFNYGGSNLYTVTLISEGSYMPPGKLLLSGRNYSDSLIVDYSSAPETTLVFDYQPDVWEVDEGGSIEKLRVQYKCEGRTIKKVENLPFCLPLISAFRPEYLGLKDGFMPGDTAVFKAQLALKGSLYGVPLEFCLWSDYLGVDTLRDTIILNPCSHRTIELKTYTDVSVPADTLISYNYRINYLNKEYTTAEEFRYLVRPPEAFLHWPLNDTFSIGQNIDIEYKNSIKTPSIVDIQAISLSGNGVNTSFTTPGEVTIPGEGSYIFPLTVPQWKTGQYYLEVESEIIEGRGINLDLFENGCPIYIDGIEADIQVSTSSDYYGYGEDIPFSSLLENGKYGWNGAESLEVVRFSDSIGGFSIWEATGSIDTFGLIPDGSGGFVLDSVYSLGCLWGAAYGQVGFLNFSNKRKKALGYSGSSYSIAVDEWDNLWFSDNDIGKIEKMDFITLEFLEEFNLPDSIGDLEGIVTNQGIVYLIASDSGRVYKMNSTSGEISGNIQPPGRGFLDLTGVAIKKDGNVLAVEDGTKTLWEFSSSGDSIFALELPSESYYGDMDYYDGKIYISTPYKIITVEGTLIDSFGVAPDSGYYGSIAIDNNGKIAVAGNRWMEEVKKTGDSFDNGYYEGYLRLFSSTGNVEAELYWLPVLHDLTFYKKDIVSFEYVGSYGDFGIYKEFGKENGSIRAGYWDFFENLPEEYRFLGYKSSDLPNSGSISYWSMGPMGYPSEEDLSPLESMYGTDNLLPIFITMQGDWQDSPVFYDCLLNLKVLGVFDSLIVKNNYDLNLSPYDYISIADTIKDSIPAGDYCILGKAYSGYPQKITYNSKLFTVIGDNLTLLLKSDKEESFAGDTFRINPIVINPLPLEEDSLYLLVKGYYSASETTYVDTSFDLLAESADSFPFIIIPDEPLIIEAELITSFSDTIRREVAPIIKSGGILSLNVNAPDIADLSPFIVTSEIYNYSFGDLPVEVRRIFLSDTLRDSVNLKVEGVYTFIDTFITEEAGTLKVVATTGGAVFVKEKFIDFGMTGVVQLDSLYEVSPDSIEMSGIIRNEGLYPLTANALFCLVEDNSTQIKADGEDGDNKSTNQPINQLTAEISAQRMALSSVTRVGKDITFSQFVRQLADAGVDTSFSVVSLPPGRTDTVPIMFNHHDAGSYELQAFLLTDSLDFMFDSTSSAVNVVSNNQVFVDSLIVSSTCDTNGAVLLTAILDNRSYSHFSGNLRISSLVCYLDSTVDLSYNAQDNVMFKLDDPIEEGEYIFTATITEGGIPVNEKTQNLEFLPVYRFDSLPMGLEVATPDSGIIKVPVSNIGNAIGERNIKVNLADVIRINEDAIIEPAHIDTFTDSFMIPEDFPGGEYFADASIFENLYPEVDTFFNVKVNGLIIQARDSLDKLVYSVNDTAELSILVKNQSLWSGDLLVGLQYGELELDTSFVLGGMEKGVLNTTLDRDTLYLDTSGIYMSGPISVDSYDSVSIIDWDVSMSDSFSVQIRTDSLIGRGSWISIEEDTVYPVNDWIQLKFSNISQNNQWIDSLVLNFKPSGLIVLDTFPMQKEVIALEVPIDSSQTKLGWGIYYPSGRSVLLDEKYVYISDSMLTLFTDKNRYEIFDTVYATLIKNFPDTNYNFEYRVYFSPTEEVSDTFLLVEDTTNFSFVIPEWTRSGTYSIDYIVESNGTQINADFLDLTYAPNPQGISHGDTENAQLAADSRQLTATHLLTQQNNNLTIQPFNDLTDSPRESMPLAKQWVTGKLSLSAFGNSAFISGEHLFDVAGITVYFKSVKMDTNLYHEGDTTKIRTEISTDTDFTTLLTISSTGSAVSEFDFDLEKDVSNKFEFKYPLIDCRRGINELYLHLSKDSVSLAGIVLYFDVYVSDTIPPAISVLEEPSNTYSSNRTYQVIARVYDPDTNGTPISDTLYYRVASIGGSSWHALLPHSMRGDTHKYLIPSHPNGTHIEYILIARDEFGNASRYPEEGESDFWVLSPLKPTWNELSYTIDTSAVLVWNPPVELVYYHCGLISDTIDIKEKRVATRFTTQCLPAKLETVGLEIVNENGASSSDTLMVSVYTVTDDSLPGTKIDSFEFTGNFEEYTEFELQNVQIPEEGIFVGIKGSEGLNALLDGFGEGSHTVVDSGTSWSLASAGELLIDGVISHLPSTKLRGLSDILTFDVFKSIEPSNWMKIASGLTSTTYTDESVVENQGYSYKIMTSFGNPVDSFFSACRDVFVDLSPPEMDTIVVNDLGENELIIWTVLMDTSGIAWDSLGYKDGDTINVIPEDSSKDNTYFFSLTFLGDTLSYFLKAQDSSLIGNYARYPECGYYKWGSQAGIFDKSIPDSTYLIRMLNVLTGRSIEIKYALSEESNVQIIFFDILGRKAKTLVDETQKAGYYKVPMQSTELPQGVYFLRMEAGDYRKSVKLVKLR